MDPTKVVIVKMPRLEDCRLIIWDADVKNQLITLNERIIQLIKDLSQTVRFEKDLASRSLDSGVVSCVKVSDDTFHFDFLNLKDNQPNVSLVLTKRNIESIADFICQASSGFSIDPSAHLLLNITEEEFAQ